MSNLYKGRYIVSEPEKTRVINSNQIVEEKLEAIRKKQEYERLEAARLAGAVDGEEGEDGFTAGIVAGKTEVFTREDIDKMMSDAEEDAAQIVAAAKEQADGLLQNAKIQSEQVLAEARQTGYAEGLQKGNEEARQQMLRMEQEAADRKHAMEEEYQQEIERLEPDLLDVILQVFNKVFHIQFDDKKEILTYLVSNAIQNIEGCKEFRIHAGEDNYPYLASHLKEIRGQAGSDYSIEIMADGSLDHDKCVIETDSGMFDCSMGVHLENLMKDLRSLCS